MNTLSKVFVVINLVFGIAFCFMTLTLYSKRVDFKDKWEKKGYELDHTKVVLNNQISALTAEKNRLTERVTTVERNQKEIFARNQELEQSVKNKSNQFFECDSERRLLAERHTAQSIELKRRHDQIDRMHKIVLTQQKALEIAKANMMRAESHRMEMENEYNSARQQLVAVQKEKARLEKDLHHHSWMIQTLMDHGVPVRQIIYAVEEQPPKPIYGRVLAVRPEVNLVMLSVGTDDGVKKGYRFTIYDGERYVGKVEVERPFSDMCSARILPDWTKEEIREGYDASTALGMGS